MYNIDISTKPFRAFIRLMAAGAFIIYGAVILPSESTAKTMPASAISGAKGKKAPAVQQVAAEEQKNYPLDGLIGDLEDDFNNTAEYLDVRPRIKKVRCENDIICEYRGGGGSIRVLTSAKKDTGGQTENVTMIFNGDKKKVTEYFVYVVVLVASYAPVLPGPERAKVLAMIADGLKKPEMKGEIELDGVRFTMQAGQGLGIWLFLTDARNPVKDKK